MIDYEYDRVRPVGEYLTAPSDKLHKDLYNLKQESFPAQYRIVFSCFEDISDSVINDFIVSLQKSLVFLDIPNFFVLVLSNHRSVEDMLIKAKNDHSHEDAPIGFLYVDGAPLQEFSKPVTAILNPPETICAQPWISLDITPRGHYRPCCFYNSVMTKNDGTPFRADVDSFEDVYYSEHMESLRTQFRQGSKPEGCARCWREEANNTVSKRQLLKHRFKPHSYNAAWEQSDIKNVIFVSAALGNVCNLKCRICSASSSSQIAVEDIEQSGLVNKKEHVSYRLLSEGHWVKNDDAALWGELFDPELKYIHLDLSGGEPMLSTRHFSMLQKLIEVGRAKDITLHYNSNASIFPEEHIELFKQFKGVDIALSIDDIGQRFELERHGAIWDEVEANINKYLALNESNIDVSLHLTVNIQNVYYLPEITDWVKSKKFSSVHFSTLYTPNFMNISMVTAEARTLILEKLKAYKQPTTFITNTINILESAKTSNGKEFCNYMKRLDSIRKENFSVSHPEIAKAMGYLEQE